MSIKIIFVGNPFGGDDGIGPYLYNQLKDSSELKKYELLELGVIGIDILSYIEDGDQLIIVDALLTEENFGEVAIIDEDKLIQNKNVISQHDFGIEQTIVMLRKFKPKIKKINLLGIKVKNVSEFSDKLSNELLDNITQIKKDLINCIRKLVEN